MKNWISILCLCSFVAFGASKGHSAEPKVSQTSSNEVLQAMKRIIIPEIEFKKAPIKDVIDFLVKAALTNDPDKKGVNILLLGSAEAACTNDEGLVQTHDVTLSARYITLYNALKITTSMAGLKCRIKKCRIKGPAIVVMDRDDPDDEPIIMRMYPVEPTHYERTRGDCSPSATNTQSTCHSDLKTFFNQMGVSWPRGSSIIYNVGIGKVIVANTEENLQKFEYLLSELNVTPSQIQITAQFVQLDSTNIPHASLGDSGADTILALCTNGTGKLIAAPTVIMRSGEASCIKGVTEVIYPTEYIFTDNGNTNDEYIAEELGGVLPASFATREVGVIMEVTPEISSYGDSVSLVIKCSYVDNPSWKDYGRDMPMGDEGSKYVPMEQPFFYVNSSELKLTINDGASLLAFGGMPTKDGKGFNYCVITVRIVGTDGKPIRGNAKPLPADSFLW